MRSTPDPRPLPDVPRKNGAAETPCRLRLSQGSCGQGLSRFLFLNLTPKPLVSVWGQTRARLQAVAYQGKYRISFPRTIFSRTCCLLLATSHILRAFAADAPAGCG